VGYGLSVYLSLTCRQKIEWWKEKKKKMDMEAVRKKRQEEIEAKKKALGGAQKS
jgi:hypothetical protein